MWCAVDNNNYMYHICAKGFFDSNFNQAVIDKISIFHEIAPNPTYSKNRYFKSTIGKRPTASTLLMFWQGHCNEYTFFIFGSCEPLKRDLSSLLSEIRKLAVEVVTFELVL